MNLLHGKIYCAYLEYRHKSSSFLSSMDFLKKRSAFNIAASLSISLMFLLDGGRDKKTLAHDGMCIYLIGTILTVEPLYFNPLK